MLGASGLYRGRIVGDRRLRTERERNVQVDLDVDAFFELLVERIGRLG